MRIESINLSKEIFEEMGVGLPTLPMEKPIRMRDLRQFVVLAGKNGAGKTRLLNLVEKVATKYLSTGERQTVVADMAQARSRQSSSEFQVARLEKMEQTNADLEQQRRSFQSAATTAALEADRLERQLAMSDVLKIHGPGKPKIVNFVPRVAVLGDPKTMLEEQAQQLANSFSTSLSAQGAEAGAPAYARQVFRAAVAERGRLSSEPPTLKHRHAETELQKLFVSLLGTDTQIEVGDDLNLKLSGLSDNYYSLMSDGQRVLFQLACMLHSRQSSLHDCILFMDEPENHLHPAVINQLIDRLQELLPEGQLWISTHSVPLIAHLVAKDPSCLWFADAGVFQQAGRSPEKVLDSLLGGPDGARRVNELTMLPSRLASSTFLQQCLVPPSPIAYSQGDPQLEQIQQQLENLRVVGSPLCVVDFGSGRGRLLDSLAQGVDRSRLNETVDYLAYEPHIPDAERCQRLCLELYGEGNSVPRAFSSLNKLALIRGKKFADVVVVCNVLHEVHPRDWMAEFGGASALAGLLKDDGYILFVEDYALPVGERAHEYGFLLLDEKQLEALFDVTAEDIDAKRFTRSFHANPAYSQRLIAHLVSARCLKRMTEVTRWRAIQSLQYQSLSRLKALLATQGGAASSSKLGRESALVTQLAANASLWLQDQDHR